MSIYIASVDVGTTNIKINLFNSSYELIDTLKYQHFKIYNTVEQFELDLDEIWENILTSLRKLIDKNGIEQLEIILTTAMHSLQLMHKDYSLLGSLIVWADKRGSSVLQNSKAEDLEKLYYRTGTPIHTMNPFFKIKEFKRVLTKESRIGSLKDILFYRLTGEWAIDMSNASSSGLYNLYKKDWDSQTLQMAGITEKQLPDIKKSSHYQFAKKTLLNATVKVYIGTSDGVSSNYVFNDINHCAVVSIGTSHAVRVIQNEIQLDKEIQNFSYIIHSKKYLTGLPSNNGADVLLWANKIFNSTFEELEKIAILRPKTTSLFLPYLNGERAPIWDESATASINSLTRISTRESILFSIILGMIFNIKHNVENLAEMASFEVLGLVGGITRLQGVLQLIADVLNYKLYIPKLENAETLGSIAVVKDIKFETDYKIIKPKATLEYDEMYKKYIEMVNDVSKK